MKTASENKKIQSEQPAFDETTVSTNTDSMNPTNSIADLKPDLWPVYGDIKPDLWPCLSIH